MQPIPTYRRKKIVAAFDAGETASQVAERFEVSESTVWNYLRQRKETGRLEPKPAAGGPKPKLNEQDHKRMLRVVDQEPDLTLEEIKVECDLEVHPSTICRTLGKLDRARKRKVPRAAEQQEEQVLKQRVEWSTRTADLPAEKLIFIDETGITTQMTRRYGRAATGKRVYSDVPYRHYESLTVLGGMKLDGMGAEVPLPMLIYPGGTTTQRLLEYLQGPLGDAAVPGDLVIADNLAAHKSKKFAAALAERDVGIQWLPPYSPDFNPIERLWSKIKTSLRRAKARTVATLRSALDQALDTITNTDIANWFRHSNYLPDTPN